MGGGGVSPAWLLISKHIVVFQFRKSRVTRNFITLGHEHHDEDMITREVDPSPKTRFEYEEEMDFFFVSLSPVHHEGGETSIFIINLPQTW